MKTLFTSIVLLVVVVTSNGQALLETIDGSEIAINPISLERNLLLGNINISDESLQFKTYFALSSLDSSPKKFITAGLKGKPSDGIASIFSGGNFNPSTNLNITFTKVNLFSNIDTKYTDYFNIRADYSVQKQVLFDNDASFNEQIDQSNFHGGGVSFSYNLLLDGKHLITGILSYSYTNNYSKLKSTEIRDFKTIVDSTSGTTRQYGRVVNGKLGEYKEYDRFPIRIGYTFCPSEDGKEQPKLKLGYTLYYSSNFGRTIPNHDLGALIFLTKQNKDTGIRIPVIGLGVEASDISDNQRKNNALIKRLNVTLTTSFQLSKL